MSLRQDQVQLVVTGVNAFKLEPASLFDLCSVAVKTAELDALMHRALAG